MILPPCLTVGLLLFSSCLALLFTSSWCHRAWLWFRLTTAFSLNPSLNWLVFQWQTVCTCACLRVLQSFSSLQRSVLPVVFLVTMISTAFIWLISVIFFFIFLTPRGKMELHTDDDWWSFYTSSCVVFFLSYTGYIRKGSFNWINELCLSFLTFNDY